MLLIVDTSERQNGSRRKGGRGQVIEEESEMTDEYASALDMSCLVGGSLIKAPILSHAEIARYER